MFPPIRGLLLVITDLGAGGGGGGGGASFFMYTLFLEEHSFILKVSDIV